MRGAAVRRGSSLALVCLLAALALGACGGGGERSETTVDAAALEREADRAADVEVLNQILSRQRAVIDAFDRTIAAMRGRPRALAVRLRTQEEEHTVAILRELRGLEGSEAAVPETIAGGFSRDRSRAAHASSTRSNSETIEAEISAIGLGSTSAPRALS